MSLSAVGIHESVPEHEYHALDACSSSRLGNLARSPAYCRWRIDNPEEPTPAMRLGTATHYAILEPEKFEGRYVVAGQCAAIKRDGTRCENGGFIARSGLWFCGVKSHAPAPEENERPEHRTVLPQEDFDRARAIRDAVHAHRLAAALLKRETRREVSMTWEHEGLLCKGRIDILADAGFVGDVKVNRHAHPDAMERAVGDGIARQGAFYFEGLRACGRKPEDFLVIACEPEPPHEVAVYRLHADAMRCGEAEVHRLRKVYAECVKTGRWPGYPDAMLDASVPVWMLRRFFPEEFSS